jgi:hypothetical protein
MLLGCRSFEAHPWTVDSTPPEEAGFVRSDLLSRVNESQLTEAIKLLKDNSFIKLTEEQYQHFSSDPKKIPADYKPFLARGVSWGNPPMCTLVYYDMQTNHLHIDQYTYNLEIYIPGKYKSLPNPMIFLAEKEPVKIIPNAIWGGDRIVGLLTHPYAWKEWE